MRIARISTLLCLIAAMMLTASCDYSPKHWSFERNTPEEELTEKILYEGDTAAYHKFYSMNAEAGMPERNLAYAIVMANKYHYAPACLNVYEILSSLYAAVPPKSDDPEIEKIRAAIADVDSAIAVITQMDPALDSAINTINRGLDALDPETRHMALTYYGKSLF